jgi:hypothetical protein
MAARAAIRNAFASTPRNIFTRHTRHENLSQKRPFVRGEAIHSHTHKKYG